MLFQVLKKNALQESRKKVSQANHKKSSGKGGNPPLPLFCRQVTRVEKVTSLAAGKIFGLANIAAKVLQLGTNVPSMAHPRHM